MKMRSKWPKKAEVRPRALTSVLTAGATLVAVDAHIPVAWQTDFEWLLVGYHAAVQFGIRTRPRRSLPGLP